MYGQRGSRPIFDTGSGGGASLRCPLFDQTVKIGIMLHRIHGKPISTCSGRHPGWSTKSLGHRLTINSLHAGVPINIGQVPNSGT
jgi:hypothetical protein